MKFNISSIKVEFFFNGLIVGIYLTLWALKAMKVL